MNSKTNIDATYIKAELIDFILECGKYELLVNEAPFLQGNRWADLLAIQNNYLIGFEIKSERDTLKNLIAQLADYNRVFNKTYVVIAEKFLNSEEVKLIPHYNGIIVRTEKTLTMIREAKLRKRLDKLALSYFLWRKDFEKDVITGCLDISQEREKFIKKNTIEQLLNLSIKALKSRYGNSYSLFLHDRGDYTSIEDITTITRIDKPFYFYDKYIEQS